MLKVYIWRTKAGWCDGAGGSSSSSSFGSRLQLPPSIRIGSFGIDWGHVAMEIPDPSYSYVPKHYFSYWPPNKKSDKYSYHYGDDKETCGPASVTIEVENLDEEAMVSKWKEELAKDFDDLSHNCCTVAAEVLDAGFSASYVGGFGTFFKWSWRAMSSPFSSYKAIMRNAMAETFVWTPDKIEKLATYLKEITAER